MSPSGSGAGVKSPVLGIKKGSKPQNIKGFPYFFSWMIVYKKKEKKHDANTTTTTSNQTRAVKNVTA